jgi:hypothetical protein
VKECDLDWRKRYPENMSIPALRDAFEPVTAFDWAILAVAYAARVGEGEPPPTGGQLAYQTAARMNPAFAYTLQVLDPYAETPLVGAPEFTRHPLIGLRIREQWSGGIGVEIYAFDFEISITKANSAAPVVTGTKRVFDAKSTVRDLESVTPEKIATTIDPALVKAVGKSLSNLLSVDNPLSLVPCTDNYPDWEATLEYADGTLVRLATYRSNVYFAGRPWQVLFGRERYVQFSPEFVLAVYGVMEALNLPRGETAAQNCGGIDDPLDIAFDSQG